MIEIQALISRLREKYPNAKYELNWEAPEQLLVATILAAQCTDERVNRVTATLFKKYPSPEAFANAKLSELEEDLRPTGYYRQKAKSVKSACKALVDHFNSRVPHTMGEMLQIPGVARKTANVVLNTAFNEASGIIVDTHVARVSPRLGLTQQTKPEVIEQELMQMIPQSEWTFFGPAMVLHGRYTCSAKSPKCDHCIVNDICPKNGLLSSSMQPEDDSEF